MARELLEAAGVGWDDPVSPAERELYFGDVVPGLMREILAMSLSFLGSTL